MKNHSVDLESISIIVILFFIALFAFLGIEILGVLKIISDTLWRISELAVSIIVYGVFTIWFTHKPNPIRGKGLKNRNKSNTYRRKPIIVVTIIAILFFVPIFYFLANWRGLVALMAITLTIVGSVQGSVLLYNQLRSTQWRRSAIISFILGLALVLLFILSFLFDNPSALYIVEFSLSGVLVIVIISFILAKIKRSVAQLSEKLKQKD